METILGKKSLGLDLNGLKQRLADYYHITLDLGTGDGRYARALAATHPDRFVIGVDACRENLCEHSRAKLPNMLFIIACAQELPSEFGGLFSQVTINFPWGSLLEGLLACDPGLMQGLLNTSRPGTQITLLLNGGALAQAGMDLEPGAERVCSHLEYHGWMLTSYCSMDQEALLGFPSTWAKRLAYGRDPRAVRGMQYGSLVN